MIMHRGLLAILLLVAASHSSFSADRPSPPEPRGAEAWANLLPAAARGAGPTIDDRRAWQAAAALPKFQGVLKQAGELLSELIPELPDSLYLDYSHTGNRARCEKVMGRRQARMAALVLAECLEDRGRFLPAIEETLRAIGGERSWVWPAHDNGMANFKGTAITVDLRAAGLAWNLATARYWLGGKLSPEVRRLLDDELERRVFTPYERAISGGKPRLFWTGVTNNWNAVCLAGVTGAAMANIESRERRATFAAAAEKYVQNYLRGFTPDGYCSEGIGYWNYGFAHYVMLAETLRQASGGQVDLMDRADVRRIALFGRRMEMLPGLYPAFADCQLNEQPNAALTAFLSRRYGWGLKDVAAAGLGLAKGASNQLFDVGLFDFPNSASAVQPAESPAVAAPLRDWFPKGGVLICRPAPGSRYALGAALKGGHNAEQHNHNDVGSFVVALGHATPLLDPGKEVYTARTFGNHRYDSNVLNSFGHDVPRAAGRLQQTGHQAAARVLKTEFADQADTLVLDLSAAYAAVKEMGTGSEPRRAKGGKSASGEVPVPFSSLKKLDRTFIFSR
jgi:hypothetical protein